MKTRKSAMIPWYVFGLILLLCTLIPFLWGVVLSFKTTHEIYLKPFSLPQVWDFSKYIDTFRKANLLRLMKNSLMLTIVTPIIELFLMFLSSFAISRLDIKHPKLCNTLYYFFLAATSVPLFARLTGIYQNTLALGKLIPFLGINALFGLVIPYISGGIPFSTLILVGGLRGVPREMEEAAIIDGCNLPGLIFRIAFPIVRPILATLTIFIVLGTWNEYLIASVQLNSPIIYTVTLAMAQFKSEFSADHGAMLRCVVMLILPQIIFFLFFQRKIIEGQLTAGVKG